jgi:hypothetical protein
LKKKIEGVSFIQEITKDPQSKQRLIEAVDHLINQRNKNFKEETRMNLANCQRSCDNTCSRAKKLKGESEDLCKSKCYLACSNNALNNLLK